MGLMVEVEPDELQAEFERISGILDARGFDAEEPVFEPPARESDVRRLERTLALTLPTSFREALLSVSAHVDFGWYPPRKFEFEPPFVTIISGELCWSLDLTLECEESRRSWIDEVFPDPKDPY